MIRVEVNTDEFKRLFKRMDKIIEDCVVEELTEWAKADDAYLRSNNGFIDRSGNLRSSLGAAVVRNGRPVFTTAFATVLNGTKGSAAGRQAIMREAAMYQQGIAKIMVAGMDYAQAVEDIESKDVLESRRIQCEREAQAVFERAMRKAEQRINALLK